MLVLPSTGIRRSVEKHNVDLVIFSDWVEGSVLFDDEELSASDILDVLITENIYSNQDKANEMIQNAFVELARRQRWLGRSAAIRVARDRLVRLGQWQDFSALSFCLVLCFARWYSGWAAPFGNDYTDQGALFEDLTKESIAQLFPGWTVHQTGWKKTDTTQLHSIVVDLASRLGEAIGDFERWTDPRAHEAGLDILCYRSFEDNRVGVPTLLVQCASGGNWEDKVHTPDLRLWTKIIQFAAEPKKAFSMPYALSDKEFSDQTLVINGLLLDRYRLLSAGRDNPDWLSQTLSQSIVRWLDPRVAALPLDHR